MFLSSSYLYSTFFEKSSLAKFIEYLEDLSNLNRCLNFSFTVIVKIYRSWTFCHKEDKNKNLMIDHYQIHINIKCVSVLFVWNIT